jgi:hypothetical protein
MFRFTIRDLLWLTLVVALLLVMWRDRVVLNSEREAVKAKQRELDSRFLRIVDITDELHRLVQANASPSGVENLASKSKLRFPPEIERAMLFDSADEK